jgi:membrane protein
MARLREVPWVLRTIGPWELCRRVVREIGDDGVMNMAAAVAFYWLFALFPFIIFLVTLIPLLPENTRQDATAWITSKVEVNLPPGGAREMVVNQMHSIINTPRGGVLSFGLLLTLWAASNGMVATMTALDRCYDITRPRNFLVQRGVAVMMTVSVVVLTLTIVLLIPVGNIVMKQFDSYLGDEIRGPWQMSLNVSRIALGLFLMILLVSSLYQFGASVRRRWTLITPGAIFTVLVIVLLAMGFDQYIKAFGAKSYNQTYGALGGVIILLMSFYLYAVVFLIGAEINAEIDYAVLGLRSGGHDDTDPLPRLHDADDLRRFKEDLLSRQRREDV